MRKTVEIKSKALQVQKPGDPYRGFPNLLLSEMKIDDLFQCIVSDITAFYMKGIYYKLNN